MIPRDGFPAISPLSCGSMRCRPLRPQACFSSTVKPPYCAICTYKTYVSM